MKQQILIIDDSKSISFLLQTILGKKFQVITASDGYSAMSWLSKKNFPSLIITSPRLPEMQDWEMVEYLRNSGIYGDIPVVVLSSLGKMETAEKCEALGVAAFYMKPFNPVELEKNICDLLTLQGRAAKIADPKLELV